MGTRDLHAMNFGSFDSDDLNSFQPAISLPVKKRASKLVTPTPPPRPPLPPTESHDLNSSNDNIPTSPPNHDHVTPPVAPHVQERDPHQLLYNSNSYEPHMPYMPFNTMPPAYMQPYNPYITHIPHPMPHMQHVHLPHMPYGMPQQHLVSPTHSPHPHSHPHPHPHPNQHHPMPQSHPHPVLSASSPSFTPAHLHHSVHAQYTVRTSYEYAMQHPQQAQEQAPPNYTSSSPQGQESQQVPQPTTQPTAQQPTAQPPTTQPTAQPPTTQPPTTQQPTAQQPTTQPDSQPTTVQQPTVQQPTVQQPAVQQPAVQQPTVQQPAVQQPAVQQPAVQQPAVQQPAVQQPVTQPTTQPNPQTQDTAVAKENSVKHHPKQKKPRGKHNQQKQSQFQQAQTQTPQTQTSQTQTPQTQTSQTQTPQTQTPQTQTPQTQTPQTQIQSSTQTTQLQTQTQPQLQPEQTQQNSHAGGFDQEPTTHLDHLEHKENTPAPQTDIPSQAEGIKQPPKNWAALFTPKASTPPPASSATQTNNTNTKNISSSNDSHKKLNGHPTSNGKSPSSATTESSKPTPLVPMSAKVLQDLSKLSLVTMPQALPTLQSRGLKNPTNTCFLNVILQSLIHCPPFAQMLSKLGNVDLPSSQMPVTDKFVRLYKEFLPNARSVVSNPANSVQIGGTANHADSLTSSDNKQLGNTPKNKYSQSAPPLLPELFFDLLYPFSERTGIPYKDGDKVNQQDAQEFLTYILDLMHEEFLLFHKTKEPSKTTDKSDEWEEVGKKNKSSIVLTKNDTYAQSIISHTFGGKQRSSVRKHGLTPSKPSVTIQPFFCLHLDIDKPHIESLEDALDTYMEPEKLEGYTDDVRRVEVPASKHTSLEALPKVLIIHFKRFAYDVSQPRKLDKYIRFPQYLTIKKTYLSNEKVASDDKRLYSLYAVVEHRGKVAVKGHYTCDINIGNLHNNTKLPPTPSSSSSSCSNSSNSNANTNVAASSKSAADLKPEKAERADKSEWLNFDDHTVSRVPLRDVQNRLAYLLFYVQN